MERSKSTHICALVPTYNNAGTILDVLRRTHEQLRDIIVVDDGCTDGTLDLLLTLEFPVTVVSHPTNRGKGKALVSGFRKALEMGFDFALTLDADGQHYPEDIPVLLRAHDVHPNALIVGSRQFTDDNMPGKSRFANRFSNFWFRLQTTINLPDTQTGMRLYPLHRLYGLPIITSRYEAELELLVFAAWHNVQLIPVPIRVYYPPKEQRVSHFRPAYDFTRISILNCFLCLGALLFGYINMYWRTVICFGYFGLTMLLLVTPFSLLYFLFRGNTPDSRARYHRLMQRVAKHYSRNLIGLRYTIDNPHNITLAEHPSVIISNHQSLIDIMLYLSLSPKFVVMVKDYIWKNPIFAVVTRKLDCFPLSMEGDAKEALMRRVTEEGYSILLFPEGTRTTTGEIGRFHRGATYYAELFHLPVQPLLLEGMNDYLSRRQFAIKPNHVTLHILPEIPVDDLSFGDCYKRQSKSLELHYSALLHSNRIHVGILGAGVGGLFCGARTPEDVLNARIEALLSQSENSDLGFRLYKTAAGFRLAVEGRRLEPGGKRANALMRIFNADHLYANLCVSQKCYRARLTPKPSRMKMKRYDDTPSWVDEYDRRRQDYAVCRFVCAKGRRLDSPAIVLHDEKTMCGSGLSLA